MDGEDPGAAGEKDQGGLIRGYIQNAEQNDSTIWQRVKKAKDV